MFPEWLEHQFYDRCLNTLDTTAKVSVSHFARNYRKIFCFFHNIFNFHSNKFCNTSNDFILNFCWAYFCIFGSVFKAIFQSIIQLANPFKIATKLLPLTNGLSKLSLCSKGNPLPCTNKNGIYNTHKNLNIFVISGLHVWIIIDIFCGIFVTINKLLCANHCIIVIFCFCMFKYYLWFVKILICSLDKNSLVDFICFVK